VFAGTADAGVFLSTDNGANWHQEIQGMTEFDVISLAVSGQAVFAGTPTGLFVSNDTGSTWTVTSSGLGSRSVRAIAPGGGVVFLGTNGGVYRSSDTGATWAPANRGLTDLSILALAVSGTSLVAGTATAGFFRSTDGGENWAASNAGVPPPRSVNVLAGSGSALFAGTNTYGRSPGDVLLSTDAGISWTPVEDGLPGGCIVRSFAVCGTDLFAGTAGYAVWKRPLAEMVLPVERGACLIPERCQLGQNYPNPFNPSTTVRFSIPQRSHVTLKVFDVLGREVATLVDEVRQAGAYTVTWEATGRASGLYLYRMVAGSWSRSGKMVVVR
jgi:hypothetical protein